MADTDEEHPLQDGIEIWEHLDIDFWSLLVTGFEDIATLDCDDDSKHLGESTGSFQRAERHLDILF